jgi:hypothetical protein
MTKLDYSINQEDERELSRRGTRNSRTGKKIEKIVCDSGMGVCGSLVGCAPAAINIQNANQ